MILRISWLVLRMMTTTDACLQGAVAAGGYVLAEEIYFVEGSKLVKAIGD